VYKHLFKRLLKPGQWNAVKKAGWDSNGLFQNKAWDGIKRENGFRSELVQLFSDGQYGMVDLSTD